MAVPNASKNLREWEPNVGDAKNVEDTKMLNTVAREVPETVDAVNSTKEYVTTHMPFGELGATGRR